MGRDTAAKRDLDPRRLVERKGGRAREKAQGGRCVPARETAPTCSVQNRGRTFADRSGLVIEGAELAAQHARLLEVVADDLRRLGQPDAELVLEPRGEQQVEVGAAALGGAAVGGVPQQQVVEAERHLVVERGLGGPDEHVVGESRERIVDRCRMRWSDERRHCSAVEDLALDCRALERTPLLVGPRVEPSVQQCL